MSLQTTPLYRSADAEVVVTVDTEDEDYPVQMRLTPDAARTLADNLRYATVEEMVDNVCGDYADGLESAADAADALN